METNTPEALDFFNQAEKTFINLYFRWQDEYEYEDIKDYQLPLNSLATKCGVSITKMNKRPFGCDFSVAGKNFTIKVTSRSYSYSSKK
jgi:hypothetical protein